MISKRVEKVPHSGIRAFFDLVLGMPEVISLGVGEPDFITPWRIREKAITALEEGITSYTSNKGLKALRQEISYSLEKKHSLRYDPEEEILITVGVSEALDLVLRTILDPKDKVIVVSPHYVAYPALVELNMGHVLYLETTLEEKFKINLTKLKRLLKENPKAIIFNYPANPTGVTYSRKELEAIAKELSKKDLLVITDEVYEDIVYKEKHVSFPSLKGMRDRVILLNGFSKGSAMTGFRVGYACGAPRIIQAMMKIHSFAIMCVPTISQIAAVQALRAEKDIQSMVKEYKRRRDFMVKELNRLGLITPRAEGAFYCFSSLEKYKVKGLDFAKRLLMEENVAVVPGSAFGARYDSFVRISYASSFDDLKEAIVRIERFLKKL
ncbi:MAG: aminotransferase class I/II-fold pyridoxal phosphate-dependent enzyme [Candidatus Omnitrophica bacterium]|nr:aminotransferase class I/II-fold pyridoxal phosphate-dependent enzyme [Candidatus Omnitrophota bacterium]